MDNRILSINGKGDQFLQEVLTLAFKQQGYIQKCDGWAENEAGLILLWSAEDKETHKFPGGGLTAEQVTPIVSAWLKNNDPNKFDLGDWEHDLSHDGHNSVGFRVYCEDWGHAGGFHCAICAVKPVYLWHGK